MSADDPVRRSDVLAMLSTRRVAHQDVMARASHEEDPGAYNAAYFRSDELNLTAKAAKALPASALHAAALRLARAVDREMVLDPFGGEAYEAARCVTEEALAEFRAAEEAGR